MTMVATRRNENSAIERLGAFIATAPMDHSPVALERSRNAVLDTIGCMFFGHGSAEAQSALASVSDWGSGNAPVVGGSARLPGPWAAFVNGTAAHSLDFDDWDDPSLTHSSAVLLPAILATMAETGGTGADLLDAHIVGVETLLRIGEAVNPSHYWKGWHATNTIGAVGAAAASARLLKLDALEAANALSLATSMTGGFLSQFGAMAKPMHAGLAAKSGVVAASLARSGMTGIASALDGPVSFRSTMSDADENAFDAPLEKLGRPWAIEEYGLHIKLFPSCGGTHRIIDAALKLRESHGLSAEDVSEIELDIPIYLAELLPYRVPSSKTEALFSFPYCAAAALSRGKVGIDEFEPEALASEEILGLAGRTRISIRDGVYEMPVFREGEFDRIKVGTRDGRVLEAATDIPLGAPPRFADSETVAAKFADCAKRGVSVERAREILRMTGAEPHAWTYAQLGDLLPGDKAAAA